IDAYSTPERMVKMAKILREIHRLWRMCQTRAQIPVDVLKSESVVSEFARSKFEIPNSEAERYDTLLETMTQRYETLLETYGK
ncbi:hypothetical protein, partial [Hydrogenimonas sp.]|uniref:hypothetical protein n=1 Tax=Hydrogenimonas sp. TaxID=2231112 RepID=UPI0026288AD9